MTFSHMFFVGGIVVTTLNNAHPMGDVGRFKRKSLFDSLVEVVVYVSVKVLLLN